MPRILIAEDDPDLSDVLALNLGRHGFEIVGRAYTGHEAVDLTHSLRPDLVVTDLLMPGMYGLDVARRIKAEHPEIPVMVLSALWSPDLVEEANDAGVATYLVKGQSADIIAAAINAVLGSEAS